MPTLEELDARLTALEELLKINQLQKEFHKVVIRYAVFSSDNVKVLSYNGFKPTNDTGFYNIKLFGTISDAKKELENSKNFKNLKTSIKRLRITYELLEEV
jgi:hypothetical protein